MFPRIARFRDTQSFREHLQSLSVVLPFDESPLTASGGSPLAQPITLGHRTAGNRFAIHPMEGWDASAEGQPTEILLRRWHNFGASGAKLIWGGEAVAVVPDARANPRQLVAPSCGRDGFTKLLAAATEAHRAAYGSTDDLIVALQLTHSGRFSQPTPAGRRSRIAFHHPVLDARHGVDPDDAACVLTDAEVDSLIDRYVEAASNAAAAGFDMVDIKSCHGYLVNEFLAARRRPGRYGGDLAGRSRLLLSIIERVREACPRLLVGVRLSLFDTIPWRHVDGRGEPWPLDGVVPYDAGFGVDETDPREFNLEEPVALLRMLQDRGVAAVNLSAGCPYATPHLLRPAFFPPSDGYPPPEDPLVGVFRQLDAARQAKAAVPSLPLVGSGYTYLQEFLPHVAQAAVREGWIDIVGVGRMVLSYPEFPADVLAGRVLRRGGICRTFSDCTTAPRHGLRSGCYPLDTFYKRLEPEASQVKAIKQGSSAATATGGRDHQP